MSESLTGVPENVTNPTNEVFSSPLEYITLYEGRTNIDSRLRDIESSLVITVPMTPATRLSVNIPAHYTEMNLGRTLEEYLKQDAFQNSPTSPFEVFVLVNGLRGIDLTQTRAYKDAKAFAQANPQFPL